MHLYSPANLTKFKEILIHSQQHNINFSQPNLLGVVSIPLKTGHEKCHIFVLSIEKP